MRLQGIDDLRKKACALFLSSGYTHCSLFKKRHRYRGGRYRCLVRICVRVGNPPLPSVLLANVHQWRINWMSSVQDYPTNGTLKTVISYV